MVNARIRFARSDHGAWPLMKRAGSADEPRMAGRRAAHRRRRDLRVPAAQLGVLTLLVAGTVGIVQHGSEPEPTVAVAEAVELDDGLLAAREDSRAASRGTERAAAPDAAPRDVVVSLHGQERAVQTTGQTVSDVLAELDVVLSEDDVVTPALTTIVTNDLEVTVSGVVTTTETVTETTPFEMTKTKDDLLLKGTTIVETEGREGVATVTYLVRTVDGVEVERTAVTEVVESEPRDEVVRVGTLKVSGSGPLSPSQAKAVARSMVAERGWSADQFTCLEKLWTKESNWRVTADNPSSSAYGIPQALPGSKMASAGADWRTSARTQIRWGLGYIDGRYGTPCNAWGHSVARGWY